MRSDWLSKHPWVAFLVGALVGGLCAGIAFSVLPRQPGEQKPDAAVRVVPQLDHARFMRRAIEQAKQVPALPFGAVIVDKRTNEVLAEGHNRSANNPTWHGEIDVINTLSASAQRPDDWAALVLYTTAEPCPMCQSAIEWAGIGAVVFGTSIPFLQETGWWQIDIRADEIARRTPFRRTAVLGGVLQEECNALFRAGPPAKFRNQ